MDVAPPSVRRNFRMQERQKMAKILEQKKNAQTNDPQHSSVNYNNHFKIHSLFSIVFTDPTACRNGATTGEGKCTPGGATVD